MPALGLTYPTLLDVARVTEPDGKIAMVAELLNEQNEVLNDMVFIEGNLPTGHRTSVRTGLPTPTWRKLYGGVQPSKSTTAQVTDATGMLEAYAEVDKALADLNGNTAAFRFSEDLPHIEGMNQEMASTLWYGNEGTQPEAFTGFAPRFNSLTAANGENVLTDSMSAGANTSIWLVGWGSQTIHGIYPKGSQAGLNTQDLGEVTIENVDGANGRMQAYRTHYRWDCGLVVRDWRYVVRITFAPANVVASAATGPDLFALMGKAMRRIPSLGMCKPVFYASRDALDAIDLQANARSTLAYRQFEDAQGKLMTAYRGIPLRRSDAILNTEANIV